jgi:hypothetical protein
MLWLQLRHSMHFLAVWGRCLEAGCFSGVSRLPVCKEQASRAALKTHRACLAVTSPGMPSPAGQDFQVTERGKADLH